MTDAPPSGEDRRTDSDVTGVVSIARPRLADFVDGSPRLPVAFLLVVCGPARGTTAMIHALPATIGRSSEADHQVLDDTVSRDHCQLVGDGDELVVIDRGSSNGTRVNGHDIAGELHLRDGDLLELGSAVILVKLIA
jgi:hypothetical protein